MSNLVRTVVILCLLALVPPQPARAAHAHVLNADELKKALSVLRQARVVRHFCAPCADTTWREERVGRVEPTQLESAGEWSIALNGNSVDIAYLYVPSQRAWRNVAEAAGITYPDIPAQLDSSVLHSAAKQDEFSGGDFAWTGIYEFEDWTQHGASNNRITTLYTLALIKEDTLGSARFHADGLETFHRMQVSMVPDGEDLHIVLDKYLRENYGEPFSPGDTLFTLKRQAGGESATEWKSLRPHRADPGQGFKRTHLNPLQSVD